MKPRISYMICSTFRSGSWLLAEALESTGAAGRPREYLEPPQIGTWKERWGIEGAPTSPQYLARMLKAGTTANGVFGLKVHRPAFRLFIRSLCSDATEAEHHRTLEEVFPGLLYVWLRRLDKVAQAVSWYRAVQTNVWWSYDGAVREDPSNEPVYRYEPIARLYDALVCDDREWEAFLRSAHQTPIEITYEQVSDDPASTVTDLLQRLGVLSEKQEITVGHRLRRQADEESARWCRLFRQHYVGTLQD